jgi:hypothetical protein
MKNQELKKSVLDQFWNIYEVEGTIQALSWLESLKYYEEYCCDDVYDLTKQLNQLQM